MYSGIVLQLMINHNYPDEDLLEFLTHNEELNYAMEGIKCEIGGK